MHVLRDKFVAKSKFVLYNSIEVFLEMFLQLLLRSNRIIFVCMKTHSVEIRKALSNSLTVSGWFIDLLYFENVGGLIQPFLNAIKFFF